MLYISGSASLSCLFLIAKFMHQNSESNFPSLCDTLLISFCLILPVIFVRFPCEERGFVDQLWVISVYFNWRAQVPCQLSVNTKDGKCFRSKLQCLQEI